jgi:hypothetical protein
MIKINGIKGHASDDLDWIYLTAQGSMLHFFYRSDTYSDVKKYIDCLFSDVPNFNIILLALQLYTSAQTSAFRNARLSLDTHHINPNFANYYKPFFYPNSYVKLYL